MFLGLGHHTGEAGWVNTRSVRCQGNALHSSLEQTLRERGVFAYMVESGVHRTSQHCSPQPPYRAYICAGLLQR